MWLKVIKKRIKNKTRRQKKESRRPFTYLRIITQAYQQKCQTINWIITGH